MKDQRLVKLIKQLRKKTKEGKIAWESTLEGGVFQASFPGSSVHLFRRGADIVLEIYNDEGIVVEDIADTEINDENFPEDGGSYPAMSDLYSLARRRAMGVDETIDNLLAELEG